MRVTLSDLFRLVEEPKTLLKFDPSRHDWSIWTNIPAHASTLINFAKRHRISYELQQTSLYLKLPAFLFPAIQNARAYNISEKERVRRQQWARKIQPLGAASRRLNGSLR